MLYSRLFSFLLFLLSFGMLVSANPVDTSALVQRDTSTDLVARTATEDQILSILLDLQAKVNVEVTALDSLAASGGKPDGPVLNIIADINAAVDLLAVIDPDTSGIWDSGKDAIVKVVVAICASIVLVLVKFPLTVVLLVTADLDVSINKLFLVLEVCITGILKVIATLIVDVDLWVSLKLVLSLATLGLIKV